PRRPGEPGLPHARYQQRQPDPLPDRNHHVSGLRRARRPPAVRGGGGGGRALTVLRRSGISRARRDAPGPFFERPSGRLVLDTPGWAASSKAIPKKERPA